MVSLAGAFMTCGDVVAGWWQERSVEGRLEELVGLYNAEVHGHRRTHRTIHSIDPAPSSPYQPGRLTTIFP